MSASPRRRSLLGRSGAARRASDRRSVTAPLRIGRDTKLTIEELEALAIEDFPDDDDEDDFDDEDFDDDDDDEEGDHPFEDEGDLGLALGEDTVRSDVEVEATGTVWTRKRGNADPALPIGLPTGPHVALDVIEQGVAGSGYLSVDKDDSFVHDDPPSEEVRKDPRFHGIDFSAEAEPPVDTVRMDRPSPAVPASATATSVEGPEPLRLYGMVAALLGSGSVAVIVVCVLLGTVAVGSLLLAGGAPDEAEAIAPAVVAPEPVEEPIVEEPIVEEPTVEEPIVEEPMAGEPVATEPVAGEAPRKRRPQPVPVEVVAPEPVVEAPAPAPAPEPAVVEEDPGEDDKRGLFGKKKKK